MNDNNPYWNNVCKMAQKQRDKGIEKYGFGLEDNDELTEIDRIVYLQEELIDGLMYCEHIKAKAQTPDAYTPNQYQREALRTANHKTPMGAIANGCLGLAGEAGEVVDHLKKHLFQGHALDYPKMREELGDLLWYAAILANALQVDLETVMKANIEKLKRRYPDGFDPEKSINRDEPAKCDEPLKFICVGEIEK